MRRLALPALGLGVLGLLGGLALRVYGPAWTGVGAAAATLGALLLLAGLFLSLGGPERLRAVWGRRTTRYGLHSALLVALILGVIVLVEAVSYRHHWRLDLTENRRHSLAPQTLRVLKELRVSVRAIGFFRPDQPARRTAQDLLEQYAARSDGRFTWEMVDADRHPGLARRYGVEVYGTVVLEATLGEGKVKEEKVTEVEEEKLTNALIRVTREGRRAIYFLAGHGERALGGTDRTGLSELKAAVEKLNYEARELLLAREGRVPDDAALVVVAGPQKDLLPPELEALAAYLARAGKLLLMVDPFQAPGLGPFLERYGLGLAQDVVIDVNPLGRVFQAGPEIPVVADYPAHPITQGFRVLTLFPLARTVTVRERPPEGVTVQPLARTGPEAWGETSEAELRSGRVQPGPDDTRGPLTLAAVATVEAREVPPERKGARARLVVFGDSDFATNGFLNVSGNRDLVLNALSWLAEEEQLIAIRPREATRPVPVLLTAAQGQVIFWVPVVLVPLAMVAGGVLAVAARRFR